MTSHDINLGYGLITCQRHPAHDEGWPPLYAEALELAAAAEAHGLDSVWVSEHHFVDDGHLPSLLTLLAAMSARTTRIRVGTALLLVPLLEPLRVLEDAAVVDLVSGGRLTLGLGLGWREEEFEAFGIAQASRVGRLTSFVSDARRAWGGLPLDVHGGVAQPVITPSPVQAGGPPLWIGALAETAVRRAGRIADGFMATEVTPAELAEQVGWAREEHRLAGRSDELSIALHLPLMVERGGLSFADASEALRYPGWKYEDMSEARSTQGPLRSPSPATAEELDRLRETSIIGTPAEVAEQVRVYAEAAGGRLHMIARSYLPTLTVQERRDMIAPLGDVAAILHG